MSKLKALALAAVLLLGCKTTTATTTVTTGPGGTAECVTFSPPLVISGMSCASECAAVDAAGLVTWRLDCGSTTATSSKTTTLVMKQQAKP